jgi:hypothetical protein
LTSSFYGKEFIMWIFTDLADWFDKQKSQANRMLDSAVENSDYNQGVMIVAAGTHAAMEFGGAFVDLLRFGDGMKAGGLKGWGQDALRFVAIFPFGKAAQMMKTAKATQAAKVVVDIMPRAGICAWVASAKALQQVGHSFNGKVLVTIDDLAQAAGVPRQAIGGFPDLFHITAMLRQVGAKVGASRRVASMREVEQMVPYDGSGVVVVVEGVNVKTGELIAHLVYAYREMGGVGRVRIMDRTINQAAHRPYRNLVELAEVYPVHSFVPVEAAVLHNVFVRILYDLPRLLIPVPAVIGAYER